MVSPVLSSKSFTAVMTNDKRQYLPGTTKEKRTAELVAGVGAIGGIIGTSVSASFLFLIASINIYFLIGALRTRKEIKQRQALGLPPDTENTGIQGGGCMVRIIAPVLKTVNRSWKMYPVGVLFGFGKS